MKKKIMLNLFKEKIKFDRSEVKISKSGYTIWKGLSEKDISKITLVQTEKGITASIHKNNELYKLELIEDNFHLITEIDNKKLDKCFEPRDNKLTNPLNNFVNNSLSKKTLSKTNSTTQAIIKVLVAYTSAAKSASSDIDALITLAIEESNDSYANSNIYITLQLAYKYEVNFNETYDIEADLNKFQGKSDGFMDEVHTYRDNHKADVCILLTDNAYAYAGLASAINAYQEEAFVIVEYSYATGNYTFSHEIGHLQGARHNTDPNGSYEHGYEFNSGNWRTIMAVYNTTNRIQYWSNPNVSSSDYNNVPMGTTSSNDNARKLNETRFQVSNFRFNNIQNAINEVSSGDKLFITSGTYNESLTISKDIEFEGENETTVIINGDVTFSNASFAGLRNITVNGIIEVNSGHYNTINNVTTKERILWNSSNDGYISNVTEDHSDKYGIKIYNSSDVTINNFNSSSSSKYGVYGSSASLLTMEYSSFEEKTFAIQITSGASASIYYINFANNDYDVWESGDGDGVGYYGIFFWSNYPTSVYGNVYEIAHPSQSSSSNLAKIGNISNKSDSSIYSNDVDFNEALNIFRFIKNKKRIARKNKELFDPSQYKVEYYKAIGKFKKVVTEVKSEKLAISSQLYLYFLYQDLELYSEFISYLEPIIANSVNRNLKYRSMILLAYTQIREGEYKTATEYIDNVIQESADEDILANSLYDNGMIFKYFLKDENEAKKYFNELIESYPTNILADHASDELEGSNFRANSTKSESVNQMEISNYPNPFNPTTQISYQIPKDGFVNLVVYNTLGQVVAELVNEHKISGEYSVQFNATDLSSGVYLYKLESGGFSKVSKMLLLR